MRSSARCRRRDATADSRHAALTALDAIERALPAS
jgi:hypothetical protein